jgi:putative Ca2+/H+ antiporter (TMEM165/GDT1 family)
MAIEWDPITFINLVLCIIIVILGSLCYLRSHEKLPLFIGAAFGLFGISHAATLAGLKIPLTIPLVIVRTLAYVLVIIALWLHLKDSLLLQETRQGWVDYFKSETAGPDEKKDS